MINIGLFRAWNSRTRCSRNYKKKEKDLENLLNKKIKIKKY